MSLFQKVFQRISSNEVSAPAAPVSLSKAMANFERSRGDSGQDVSPGELSALADLHLEQGQNGEAAKFFDLAAARYSEMENWTYAEEAVDEADRLRATPSFIALLVRYEIALARGVVGDALDQIKALGALLRPSNADEITRLLEASDRHPNIDVEVEIQLCNLLCALGRDEAAVHRLEDLLRAAKKRRARTQAKRIQEHLDLLSPTKGLNKPAPDLKEPTRPQIDQPVRIVADPAKSRSVEQLIQKMRAGIEASGANAAKHYDLATALMDMGCYADAVREFQIAYADPQYRDAACESMLQIFVEQADPVMAEALIREVDWDKAAPGLQYWRARFAEASGDLETARQFYSRVAISDQDFADTRERLGNLSP